MSERSAGVGPVGSAFRGVCLNGVCFQGSASRGSASGRSRGDLPLEWPASGWSAGVGPRGVCF